jgi:hypothetical protein
MQNKYIQVLILVVVFVVGFVLGKMNVATPADAVIESAKETFIQTQTSDVPKQEVSETTTPGTDTKPSPATSISVDALTDSQKKMLESLGVNTEAITVTAAMIACAEAKLGKARIEEIKNGATPSMLEGVSLMACYK